MPKWPVKRTREGSINLEAGPGISLYDGEVQVDSNSTLSYSFGGQVGVNSNIVKPFREQVIFSSGDYGSNVFRIPTIIELQSGLLLAAADIRFDSSDDYHCTSIGLIASDDGGLTWMPRHLFEAPKNTQFSRFLDSCLVQDGSGIVYLFTVYFENSNHIRNVDANYDFVYYTSADDGRTWSNSKSLKFLKKRTENYLFQCPGIGIVMKNGTIVVPIQVWYDNGHFSSIIYSVDGETWIRAAADGTAAVLPPFDTTECQVAEFPVGTLILVCRREGTASSISQRVRVIIYTTDLGSTWYPHATNLTLRQRNPCMASLLKIISPAGEPVLLYCAPLADNINNVEGRSLLTLQYLPLNFTEWVPVGTVLQESSFGYSGLCFSKRFNRLYVVTEEVIERNVASCIVLRDISRFFGALTAPYGQNVNLGYAVTCVEENCSLPGYVDYLRYRIVNGEIWISGALMPPKGGTTKFPDEVSTLFTITIPQGFFVRGWIVVFGTEYDAAFSVVPFLLEYTYTDKVYFKCFAAPPSGPKLSDMKRLYVPACRIAITG